MTDYETLRNQIGDATHVSMGARSFLVRKTRRSFCIHTSPYQIVSATFTPRGVTIWTDECSRHVTEYAIKSILRLVGGHCQLVSCIGDANNVRAFLVADRTGSRLAFCVSGERIPYNVTVDDLPKVAQTWRITDQSEAAARKRCGLDVYEAWLRVSMETGALDQIVRSRGLTPSGMGDHARVRRVLKARDVNSFAQLSLDWSAHDMWRILQRRVRHDEPDGVIDLRQIKNFSADVIRMESVTRIKILPETTQ